MAVQPDGKVIMVGGTFSDFIMARFNADGTLDEDFGDDGKVTTPIPGADALGVKEALAVAIQRDGKIVVAGDASTPRPASRAAIVLVRYDSNGRLDNSFGAGGFVFGPTFLFGRAFAVAIDGDDRIVVAGDTPKAGNTDFGDFMVARFNANGSIDSSFGEAGIAVTDIGGVTNEAHGLKVLADNSLLVSGFAPIVVSASNGGPVVASAPFTASCGTGRTARSKRHSAPAAVFSFPATTSAEGWRCRATAGSCSRAASRPRTFPATKKEFALMRLLANGTVDDSFGNAGRVQTAFTDRGDAAFAVALQADGKIVAAGGSNIQINSNFAVARYDRDGALDDELQPGRQADDRLLRLHGHRRERRDPVERQDRAGRPGAQQRRRLRRSAGAAMSVKIVALALIGAAAVGTVAVPMMWHALPHTMRVPFEEYDEVARMIFAQPLPDSVEIMDCAIRQTPAGKDVDEVLGCSLSVDADEFAQLLQSRSPLERRSASQIAPVLKVPYLADVPVTAEVHYTSPPEAWQINEPLIYSDGSRQRVAAYVRYVVVRD